MTANHPEARAGRGSSMTMDIASVTPEALVRELAEDNPPPEEKWLQRDSYDPTYGAKELRAAARKGWIELVTDADPACWQFRLTPAGRAAIAEHEGRE